VKNIRDINNTKFPSFSYSLFLLFPGHEVGSSMVDAALTERGKMHQRINWRIFFQFFNSESENRYKFGEMKQCSIMSTLWGTGNLKIYWKELKRN
jgi:hypothetical protein